MDEVLGGAEGTGRVDRRGFIGAGMAGAALLATTAPAEATARVRRRTLRFVHLTDVHVDVPARRPQAPDGMARALRAIETLSDRPAFILNGGDAIYDAFARDRDATRAQWRLWHDIVRAETTLPFRHCVGNHDIWGWEWRDDPAVNRDALYGKAWALREFELQAAHYGFDAGGWRFLVLDSTAPHPAGYSVRLDDAQFEWLAGELDAVSADTPICIVSHAPLLSAAAYIWFGASPTEVQHELIHRVLVHTDGVRLKELFRRHPNVRLCLSGHLHMQERLDYLGVSYVCSGAVCGNWWNADAPAFHEFGPAWAVVDLFDDGSFEHRMVPVT